MAISDEDFAKIGEMIGTSISEALRKEETPANQTDEVEDDTPSFEGDPTNVEDLEKHREALRKHNLQKRLAKAFVFPDGAPAAAKEDPKPAAAKTPGLRPVDEDMRAKTEETDLQAMSTPTQRSMRHF